MGVKPKRPREIIDGKAWIIGSEDPSMLRELKPIPPVTPESAKKALVLLRRNLTTLRRLLEVDSKGKVRILPIKGGWKVCVENTNENQQKSRWIKDRCEKLLRQAIILTNKELEEEHD